MDAKRCAGTRRDGQPCTAPALTASAWCFAHDPDRAAERDAARAKGGRNGGALARLHRLAPPALVPVFDELMVAFGEVHEGKLSPQRGMAMAAMARAMAAVLQAGAFEERLRAIESRAG